MSAAFAQAFTFVVGAEGGFTDDPGDPGNWTGGAVGVGQCNGTKYGISAASYPTLDIADLTEVEAQAIYLRDYWMPIQGDQLPTALALVVFDGAVNSGVAQSAMWLQTATGVTADGAIGPETLSAVASWGQPPSGQPLWALCADVLARRMNFLGEDTNFSTFGLGWSRRVMRLAFQAATLL